MVRSARDVLDDRHLGGILVDFFTLGHGVLRMLGAITGWTSLTTTSTSYRRR